MFYPIGKCYKIEAFYKETFLITITRARGLMIKIGRLCLVITENENGFVYQELLWYFLKRPKIL